LPAKLTVTAISDGEGYSMIPDLCIVNIDIRLTPALDDPVAVALLQEAAANRAPRQAQIAVICLPRLAGAEQQRIVQNGDLVWKAGSDPARTAAGPLVGPAVFVEG
jgi:succinyl-diaminopimelate desuccinylase